MKKLLLTSILSLSLLLPAGLAAASNTTTGHASVEFSSKKPKKSSRGKKSRRSKRSKNHSSSRSSRSYSKSNDCTYNGHPLTVGPRGGCYYYSGNSKQYVDRAYCSGCN